MLHHHTAYSEPVPLLMRCDRAADQGVVLGLEVVNRYETNLGKEIDGRISKFLSVELVRCSSHAKVTLIAMGVPAAVNTAAQAVELIEDIGEANVKVHLDRYPRRSLRRIVRWLTALKCLMRSWRRDFQC
jgi:hypothetical protein